jgi:hypothetical protein
MEGHRVASFHLVRSVPEAVAALARLGTDRLRLAAAAGRSSGGSSAGAGVTPVSASTPPHRLFALWEDDEALGAFLARSPIARRWRCGRGLHGPPAPPRRPRHVEGRRDPGGDDRRRRHRRSRRAGAGGRAGGRPSGSVTGRPSSAGRRVSAEVAGPRSSRRGGHRRGAGRAAGHLRPLAQHRRRTPSPTPAPTTSARAPHRAEGWYGERYPLPAVRQRRHLGRSRPCRLTPRLRRAAGAGSRPEDGARPQRRRHTGNSIPRARRRSDGGGGEPPPGGPGPGRRRASTARRPWM